MSDAISVEGAFHDLATVRILVPHTAIPLFDRAVAALTDEVEAAAESRTEVERVTEVARFFDSWAQFTIEHGGSISVFFEAAKGLQLARDKYAALTPKEADGCKSDEYRAALEAAKGEK